MRYELPDALLFEEKISLNTSNTNLNWINTEASKAIPSPIGVLISYWY